MTFRDYLVSIKACPEAVGWVEKSTFTQAWKECARGDWMMWLIEKHSGRRGWVNHGDLVSLACDFAERVLKIIPVGEDRPQLAIEAAHRCAEIPTAENKRVARVAGDAAWAAGAAAGNAARAAMAARAAAGAAGAAAGNAESIWQADLIRKRVKPGKIMGVN